MFKFKDEYHPKVEKDLRVIDKSVRSEIKDFHIPEILKNPYPYIADELTGDLKGIFSYHFKKNKVQYRVSYIIDNAQKIVYILRIGKREGYYEILRRRL
ncbi:MAG: type II toxin-antitoxin system mRNA interferase toxin, RelE/StbE family [Thermodesulfobacteriota bacterium]|nr:type II toxin-antitoxin system mRNA interferase toxin, RelE/StbE family [Thermodesulfobacteriota bacterium]